MPLLTSFTNQNSGTNCMINMARARFAHWQYLGAIKTAKAMFVHIEHTIKQCKKMNRQKIEKIGSKKFSNERILDI